MSTEHGSRPAAINDLIPQLIHVVEENPHHRVPRGTVVLLRQQCWCPTLWEAPTTVNHLNMSSSWLQTSLLKPSLILIRALIKLSARARAQTLL
jgi:hypothetical protein